MVDCHNHSNFSFDAVDTVEAMCRRAEELNLKAFAITDHSDLDGKNLDECIKVVSNSVKAMEKFRNENKTTCEFLTGIELGEAIDYPEDAKKMLTLCNYDVVIGSYHNSPTGEDFYFMDCSTLTDEEIANYLNGYFDSVLKTVLYADIDVIAHITYPFRYVVGDYKRNASVSDYLDKITAILKAVIDMGISLEVNTSGLRQKIKETLPNREILTLYRSLGGDKVSLGSDSHNTNDLSRGIDETIKVIKEIGFTHITYFRKRKPVQIEI